MIVQKHWMLVLLCVSGLQGCAYMHSPAREALGKDIKDAKQKADLRPLIQAARANYETIHVQQLANLDELKSVTRDSRVLQVSVAYSRTVEQAIASLQTSIGIDPTTMPCNVDAKSHICVMDDKGFRTPYKKAKSKIQENSDLWTARSNAVRLYVDVSLPSCEAWQAVDGKAKKPWLDLAKENAGLFGELGSDGEGVTKVCRELTDGQAALTKLLKGSVQVTPPATKAATLYAPATIPSQLDAVAELQAAIDALKAEAAEATIAMAEAKKAGNAADIEEAKDPKSTTTLAKLQDATKKFSDAASKAIASSELFPSNPFLKDLALTLKSETLTAYFKTIKDAKEGEDPQITNGKAAALPILFANYFDATRKRFKAAEGYGLVTLAMQEQLIALQQQQTKRQISVLEQQLLLSQQKLQVLMAALDGYLEADAYLSKVTDHYSGATLHDALMKNETPGTTSSDLRTDLWLGMGTYIQTGVTYPSQFRKLTENELALKKADRVAASELNIQIWDAVLDANINQLQALSSFGITKDDFQKGVNNVLTSLIAVGVLK